MNDKFFLDTNVFVYSFDGSAPSKRKKAEGLIRDAIGKRNGCISFQVVQEFLNTATRKFSTPLSADDALLYLTRVLEPLCEVFADVALYRSAIETMNAFHYSFYDSLIIASALQAGCKVLYTEDLQHGQKIKGLKILNPFK
jgi:predicted nucleic acid-binding protein